MATEMVQVFNPGKKEKYRPHKSIGAALKAHTLYRVRPVFYTDKGHKHFVRSEAKRIAAINKGKKMVKKYRKNPAINIKRVLTFVGVGAASYFGMNYAVDNVPGLNTLTGTTRTLAKGGVPIALGFLARKSAKARKFANPLLASGAGIILWDLANAYVFGSKTPVDVTKLHGFGSPVYRAVGGPGTRIAPALNGPMRVVRDANQYRVGGNGNAASQSMNAFA